MSEQLLSGELMSLGDFRRHVLLELPHELYFPLEGVLAGLEREGMTGIYRTLNAIGASLANLNCYRT